MLSKFFILVFDLIYLSFFSFLDPITWPLYYVGFLYLVKVNAILFDYLDQIDLNLNLKSLIPWSFLYFLISWPLFVLDGFIFWIWFNVWTLFMFSVGYGGYLILFKQVNLSNTVSFLWKGFKLHLNFKEIFKVLIFANVFLFFKLQIIHLIPVFLLNLFVLGALFIVSRFVKVRFL